MAIWRADKGHGWMARRASHAQVSTLVDCLAVLPACALMSGLKRSLDESPDGELASPSDSAASQKPASPGGRAASSSSAASSFRNVSACNRCRLRKNRCDQRLPSCASCDKAGVKCVGYDPITKREIPRRYVVDVWRGLGSATGDWRRTTDDWRLTTDD